ncbi:hypothetical protein TRIP_B30034 [uncultured Desulfatiglans sp.]|nr:hypothetical protein TRIP_B30034 [uncultured Desulfatiglans sp.]
MLALVIQRFNLNAVVLLELQPKLLPYAQKLSRKLRRQLPHHRQCK